MPPPLYRCLSTLWLLLSTGVCLPYDWRTLQHRTPCKTYCPYHLRPPLHLYIPPSNPILSTAFSYLSSCYIFTCFLWSFAHPVLPYQFLPLFFLSSSHRSKAYRLLPIDSLLLPVAFASSCTSYSTSSFSLLFLLLLFSFLLLLISPTLLLFLIFSLTTLIYNYI